MNGKVGRSAEGFVSSLYTVQTTSLLRWRLTGRGNRENRPSDRRSCIGDRSTTAVAKPHSFDTDLASGATPTLHYHCILQH
ncbi:Exodeoxyribonuclease [Trichinella spiralis]|uniref:Exodeoxyribonuclease n=1 Tax=Trichinella spiralis TaxID=6334 RepID=A0ABR3KS75_TRISP